MPTIHPSAIIDPTVVLADDVSVGPGCVVRGNVKIGPGCDLRGRCWIEGHTTLGAGNIVFPNVTLGTQPQDWRSDPADPTQVIIGDNCVFRENVTVHRGTKSGGGITRIGNNCMLMVNSHVGHDATLEDRVTLINNVTVAGHCRVETGVWLSGYAAMHQFTTIGRFTFFGAYAGTDRDVAPYARVEGTRPTQYMGVNVVGLRRLGVEVDVIRSLREALGRLYPNGTIYDLDKEALAEYDARPDLNEHVRYLVDFVKRSTAHRFGRAREAGRFAAAAAEHE
ncbi:MAG: acyl-ACP--UDP-N-acetylglucosamine O-acyltransferase [Phycisphaerae bacterium]|nr:acyl-ACP--UDP-N-acetylglucosamine O-acyltransferase [Phycisphaerae bacterium]